MVQRMVVIATVLFMTADVFAIMALALPDWIVSHIGGETKLGLLYTCETLHHREEQCGVWWRGGAWLAALALVVTGCAAVAVTVLLLCLVLCVRSGRVLHAAARWCGGVAVVAFCLAAVIFPVGFYMEEIGGEPYQLPSSFQIGHSYIFFVLALWITVVSELFAGKICMQHL